MKLMGLKFQKSVRYTIYIDIYRYTGRIHVKKVEMKINKLVSFTRNRVVSKLFHSTLILFETIVANSKLFENVAKTNMDFLCDCCRMRLYFIFCQSFPKFANPEYVKFFFENFYLRSTANKYSANFQN